MRTETSRAVTELLKPIGRKLPNCLFETKCVTWNLRDLQAVQTDIKPGIPVSVDYENFSETREWVEGLHIPEILDKKDVKLAIKEAHYWGNVKHDGKIIACVKICTGKAYIPDFKMTLKLPEGAVYITDAYVLPDFRGKKVGPYALAGACAFIRNRGYQTQLGFTEDWNASAKKFAAKVRIERSKRIRHVRILGMNFFSSNPTRL